MVTLGPFERLVSIPEQNLRYAILSIVHNDYQVVHPIAYSGFPDDPPNEATFVWNEQVGWRVFVVYLATVKTVPADTLTNSVTGLYVYLTHASPYYFRSSYWGDYNNSGGWLYNTYGEYSHDDVVAHAFKSGKLYVLSQTYALGHHTNSYVRPSGSIYSTNPTPKIRFELPEGGLTDSPEAWLSSTIITNPSPGTYAVPNLHPDPAPTLTGGGAVPGGVNTGDRKGTYVLNVIAAGAASGEAVFDSGNNTRTLQVIENVSSSHTFQANTFTMPENGFTSVTKTKTVNVTASGSGTGSTVESFIAAIGEDTPAVLGQIESEYSIYGTKLNSVPYIRPNALLENVPGVILSATQARINKVKDALIDSLVIGDADAVSDINLADSRIFT